MRSVSWTMAQPTHSLLHRACFIIFLIFVVFKLHSSFPVWTFSLMLILAGTALQGTEREPAHSVFKHDWHSHLSGAEGVWERMPAMLIWPTGRPLEPNNYIIGTGASSTGWDFRHYLWMKWGQKRSEKTRDEPAMTAVHAALEMQHQSIGDGAAAPHLEKVLATTTPVALRYLNSRENQNNSPDGRGGENKQMVFETMKALTSCLCFSYEVYNQAGTPWNLLLACGLLKASVQKKSHTPAARDSLMSTQYRQPGVENQGESVARAALVEEKEHSISSVVELNKKTYFCEW